MANHYQSKPRLCADCLHYKTRVFRRETEFKQFLKNLKDVLRGGTHTARRALQRFGEVRVYWCALRRRGPYLRVHTIKKCGYFLAAAEGGESDDGDDDTTTT